MRGVLAVDIIVCCKAIPKMAFAQKVTALGQRPKAKKVLSRMEAGERTTLE
jgi:hypothetical protein